MQLGARENEKERFTHYTNKTFKKTASLIAYSCQAVLLKFDKFVKSPEFPVIDPRTRQDYLNDKQNLKQIWMFSIIKFLNYEVEQPH